MSGTIDLGDTGRRNAKNPVECWSCLFTSELLQCVVKYRNQYIEFLKEKFAHDRDAKLFDLFEVKAFCGLLYLAGACKIAAKILKSSGVQTAMA